MEKEKAVSAPKKRPKCVIFEPTNKAREKLDKLIKKGYSQKEILCELLEKINTSHYKKKV